jgi:hypothetical protein
MTSPAINLFVLWLAEYLPKDGREKSKQAGGLLQVLNASNYSAVVGIYVINSINNIF